MDPREEITTINVALEALERIEKAKDDLRLCVLELRDRNLAVLGIQLDELLGEVRSQLEGRLESCEDNPPRRSRRR